MSWKRRIKRSNSTYVENPSVLDFKKPPQLTWDQPMEESLHQ